MVLERLTKPDGVQLKDARTDTRHVTKGACVIP